MLAWQNYAGYPVALLVAANQIDARKIGMASGGFGDRVSAPTALTPQTDTPSATGTARTIDRHHLVRRTTPGNLGWALRLPGWHPLAPLQRFFSDGRHGGEAGAFRSAQTCRDKIFLQSGMPMLRKGRTNHVNNQTGIVGVRLEHDKRRRGAAAYTWIALWSENKSHFSKRFSIWALGWEVALQSAVQWRQQQTGLRYSEKQIARAIALRPQELSATPGEQVDDGGVRGVPVCSCP